MRICWSNPLTGSGCIKSFGYVICWTCWNEIISTSGGSTHTKTIASMASSYHLTDRKTKKLYSKMIRPLIWLATLTSVAHGHMPVASHWRIPVKSGKSTAEPMIPSV
jgi:hypothetical protein